MTTKNNFSEDDNFTPEQAYHNVWDLRYELAMKERQELMDEMLTTMTVLLSISLALGMEMPNITKDTLNCSKRIHTLLMKYNPEYKKQAELNNHLTHANIDLLNGNKSAGIRRLEDIITKLKEDKL